MLLSSELSIISTHIPSKCLLAERELKKTEASGGRARNGGRCGGRGPEGPCHPRPAPSAFNAYEDTHREEPEGHSLAGVCPHQCDHLQTEVQTTSTPWRLHKGSHTPTCLARVSSACT